MNPDQQRALFQQFQSYQQLLSGQNPNQIPIPNQTNQPHFYPPPSFNQFHSPSPVYIPRTHTPPTTPVMPDFDFLTDSGTIPDFVPETQPNEPSDSTEPSQPSTKPKQRPRHKKGKAPAKEKDVTKDLHKWTEEEADTLCTSWVETSENPIIGTDQTIEALWVRIGELYFQRMGKGVYLSVDQLSSKWNHINKKVKKFNGIYEQAYRTKKSGAGDKEVMKEALAMFGYCAAGKPPVSQWMILSKSPKWQRIYNSDHYVSRKRSSTEMSGSPGPGQSDTQGPFYDLNDDAPEDVEEIPRPIGKKQAKAKGKGKASGSVDDETEIGRNLLEEIRKFNLVEKERADLKILSMDTSKLGPKARKYIEKKQKQIEDALDVSD